MKFAQILKKIMDERQVTNYELAKKLDIHPTTVANWLDGAMPRKKMMGRLADYFNVSIEYLLGTENEKSPTPEGAELTELEKDILERMSRLTPEDRVRVDAYIQGLLAARED